MQNLKSYYYQGPVSQFGKVIHSRWRGWTKAVSKQKAYTNLAYQFKKEYGMEPWTKIELSRALVLPEPEFDGQMTINDYLQKELV